METDEREKEETALLEEYKDHNKMRAQGWAIQRAQGLHVVQTILGLFAHDENMYAGF